MKRKVIYGAGIILALGIGASLGDEKPAPSPSPSATVAASTPEPTPSPTARPTARPTATPAPAVAGTAEWPDWSLHVYQANAGLMDANGAYVDALGAQDVDAALAAVFAYMDLIDEESAWQIDPANAPDWDACYYGAWDDWTNFLLAEWESLLDQSDWLISMSGEPDWALADKSVEMLEAAVASIEQAAAECQ